DRPGGTIRGPAGRDPPRLASAGARCGQEGTPRAEGTPGPRPGGLAAGALCGPLPPPRTPPPPQPDPTVPRREETGCPGPAPDEGRPVAARVVRGPTPRPHPGRHPEPA